MTLRTATALLWPVLQIGRLFVALSTVTASPSQPRKAIADALLVAGSAFTIAGWLWVLNLCG